MIHLRQFTALLCVLFSVVVGACAPPPSVATAPSQSLVTPTLEGAASHRAHSASTHDVELTVDAPHNGATRARVRVRALRAAPASRLTVSADSGVEIDGDAAWELSPMRAGEVREFGVSLRGHEGPFGRRVFATVTVGAARHIDADGAMAWAFGPADPARVLPRSGSTLGPNGVGELGPGERVFVTSSGERLHDSRVR